MLSSKKVFSKVLNLWLKKKFFLMYHINYKTDDADHVKPMTLIM